MKPPPQRILLVEDDESDAFFMKRAMTKALFPPPIHVATNGQDAMDYLEGAAHYADRASYPLPQCVFLDLKLPFINGFQVLQWMRDQPTLKDLPVFVLTSSPEESDRERAKQLGALAYLIKPPTPEMLKKSLSLLPLCAGFQPGPA
jgi:CheY-like chemotaxis protein